MKDVKEEYVVKNSAIQNAIHNANIESNVTQKYNREIFENKKALNDYKKKIYKVGEEGEVKSIKSDYDGSELHIAHKKAENKYGSRKSYHQAEADHVVPVKHAHGFAKKMNYVSDEDVRKAINQEKNFKIIDKHLNTSKGELTNFEYVKKHPELSTEVKMKMIRDGVVSSTYVYGKLTYQDMENALISTIRNKEIFSDIATTSASIQLSKIIMEDKSVLEALVDTAKTTIKGEATAIVTIQSMEIAQITTKTIQSEFEKMSEEVISKSVNDVVGNSIDFVHNNMGDIVMYSTRVINLFDEYSQGNIDEQMLIIMATSEAMNQFTLKLGKSMGKIVGQTMIPISIIGNLVGEVVGGCIGYIVGHAIFLSEMICVEKNKYEKERIKMIRKITNEALEQLRDNSISLAKITCENALVWDEIICKEFAELEKALEEDHSEKMIESLNKIIMFWDSKCRFKTIEEFEDFFNNDDQIFVL